MKGPKPLDFLWLVTGALAFAFVGWKWNTAAAAWIAPAVLIRFFRNQARWLATLAALPLLVLASFAKFTGTWGAVIGPWTELAVSPLLCLPLVAALYADRYFHHRRFGRLLSTLIFPATYTTLDFLLGLAPGLGTGGSLGVTQFFFTSVMQLATVTGVWGISFLIGWTASCLNTWGEHGFGVGREARPALVCLLSCIGLVAAGGVRLALSAPASRTVKIAGISVAHPRNYWDLILDRAVPAGEAAQYKREFSRVEEELFRRSLAAAQGEAKIVFWSEGNLFVYEDQLADFLERAGKFARANEIYFAPSLQVLSYGSSLNDNRSVMIGPDGRIAYTYFKALSLYPTVSDRVIRFVDTPYGRVGSAICFDLDFPAYLRQAGRKRIDILLAPAFDARGGAPFHTFVGLIRGIENGFSVFRQVNEGTSMAIDAQGRVLARQDFFSSPDCLLYADVPTRGGRRAYTFAGDWLAYAAGAFMVAALAWQLWRQPRRRS